MLPLVSANLSNEIKTSNRSSELTHVIKKMLEYQLKQSFCLILSAVNYNYFI